MENKGNNIAKDAAKQLLGEDLLGDLDEGQNKIKRLQSDMSVDSCASSTSAQSGDELEGLHQASRSYDDMLGHLIYGGILNKYCTPTSTPRTDPNPNTPRFSIPSSTPRQPGEWAKHFCEINDTQPIKNVENVTPRDLSLNVANVQNVLNAVSNGSISDVNLPQAISHVLSDAASMQTLEHLLSEDTTNDVDLSHALQHVLSDALSVQNTDNLYPNNTNIINNNSNNNALSSDYNINALQQVLSDTLSTPNSLSDVQNVQNVQNMLSPVQSEVPDIFKWYEESIEDTLLTELQNLLVKMQGQNVGRGGQVFPPQQKKKGGANMGHYSSKIAESFFSMERGANGSPTSSLDFRGTKGAAGVNVKAAESSSQNKSALDSLLAQQTTLGNKAGNKAAPITSKSPEQPKTPQLRANAPAFNPNAASFTPVSTPTPTPKPSVPPNPQPPSADQLDLPDFIKNAVYKPVHQTNQTPPQTNYNKNFNTQERPPQNWSPGYNYNSFVGGQNVGGQNVPKSSYHNTGYTGTRYVQNAHNVQNAQNVQNARFRRGGLSFLNDNNYGYGMDSSSNNSQFQNMF